MGLTDTLGIFNSGLDGSGLPFLNVLGFEERHITIGRGTEFSDVELAASPGEAPFQIFPYLSRHLGAAFIVHAGGLTAEYTDARQRVHFTFNQINRKDHFKQALETPDIMVIYDGHSRYGRGACFDPATPPTLAHGEHWENGTGPQNGIYRMGYPFVAVDLEDIEHHQYTCFPLRVEDSPPNHVDRDLDARRGLSRIAMPAPLQRFVAASHASPSHRYWGFRAGRTTNLLMQAGWENTQSAPFDLGATNLACRCFCHFGCSSRDHYRGIVRGTDKKNWIRDNPPTTRLAYFTTNLSDCMATPFFLRNLLTYPHENAFQSWFASVEYAKRRANIMLDAERAGYHLY